MKKLPYKTKTTSGDIIDIKFELHDETADPVHVSNLITAILTTIDREISLMGDVSNGDVLQGVSMALAIRTHIILAPIETTSGLTKNLLNDALNSLTKATTILAPSGRA
ncbi:MAG: hypothetical protein CMM43_03115 [Rhodospirillaceae bacterium]|nr:hypothetical protein [Rhodospirillaceae bacterium]